MTTARVLGCGGRFYRYWYKVWWGMDEVVKELRERGFDDFRFAAGGAQGVDTEVANWARNHGYSPDRLTIYKANWDEIGLVAGPARNRHQYEQFKPTHLVAFPGGSGTADMIDVALAGGTPVIRVSSDSTIDWSALPPQGVRT